MFDNFNDAEERRRTQELTTISEWLFIALLFGLGTIILRFFVVSAFSAIAGSGWGVQGNVFTSLLWGLGWFAIAFVFGFIFGVPKVGQITPKTNSDHSAKPLSDQPNPGGIPYQLRVNTNLEDISDWLTKILVGATLTQLVKVPGLIRAAAEYMSNGATVAAYPSFSASVILYFSSLGFLSGYVLTRTFFSRAFGRADQPISSGDVQLLQSASIALGSHADVPTRQAIQQVAQRSSTVAITDALSGSEAAAVTKAAIITGDTDRALQAAKVGLSKAPDDPQSHLNYAIALYNANPNDPAIADELEKARKLVRPDLDPRTAEDIYNSIIYRALYLPPPEGFSKAIEYGESFVKQLVPKDASIWINLASAYGQQYKYEKEQGAAPERLQEIRAKALDAVKKALSLDPQTSSRFGELLHGSGADPADDDLKVFEDDPDFQKLIDDVEH